MAFVLKSKNSYHWPVTIELPAEGKHERSTFEAEFKQLPQSRVTEIVVSAQRLKIAVERNEPIDGLMMEQEIAGEILIGWKGILDEDGKEIPFSESAKTDLLEVPTVAQAIVGAYGESVNKARSKN